MQVGSAEVPQILMGASSSRRFGCCIKISLETTQSWRISDSDSCTCLPGLLPLTSRSRFMTSSRIAASISPLSLSLSRNLTRIIQFESFFFFFSFLLSLIWIKPSWGLLRDLNGWKQGDERILFLLHLCFSGIAFSCPL